MLRTKRFSSAVYCNLLLFVLIGASALTSASTLTTDDEFQLRVLRLLKKKSFIKNATCSQFSNLALTKNGLPALGRASPVKGIRGDMDRSFEGIEPPIFKDETTWSEKPYYDVSLSSERLQSPRSGWTLNLVRTFDPIGTMNTRTIDLK